MATLYISEKNLTAFLEALCRDAEVFGTVERESQFYFEGLNADNAKLVTMRPARSCQSAKALLYPVAQKVAVYSTAGAVEAEPVGAPKRVLVGLRQCDLAAIHMLDRVMLEGEYVDTFYKARRDAATLISTDCLAAAPSCFCTMIEGQPWPTKYFDLNLSPLKDGHVVETGSSKGEALLEQHPLLFAAATEAQMSERAANRSAIAATVKEQNREFEPERPIREVFAGEIDEKKLQKLAWDCVECGACTNICPGCHCFLMFDRPVSEAGAAPKFERGRQWDSCVLGEYARMAGAGGMKPNPRPMFRTRFVNRFLHKYLYFQNMFSEFQCSGCGRCFDACGGGIDPRRVIREMSKRE